MEMETNDDDPSYTIYITFVLPRTPEETVISTELSLFHFHPRFAS
jgi:hypothetical protein